MSPKHASLTMQLERFHQGLLDRVAPAVRETLVEAEELLARSGAVAGALPPGTLAPDFALPDQQGMVLRLSTLLARGPVVLIFIRGGWCPFCTLTMRAYQAVLPELRSAGAELVALTPQPPPLCSDTAARDCIGFPLLSDGGNVVGDRYGVTYTLQPELRDFYRGLGHDLPQINRSNDWRVPLPATFVIGRDGRVVLTHVEPVLYHRLEPAAALDAVRHAAAAGERMRGPREDAPA